MKRILICLVALVFGVCASAQTIGSTRFGVVGGFTSSSADVDVFDASSYSLYHAGLTFEIPLVSGFAIQPSLTYQVKGVSLSGFIPSEKKSNTSDDAVGLLDTKVGYVEIPVQLQWGPDLLAFRPYIFAEPFVGFAVNTKTAPAFHEIVEDRAVIRDLEKAAVKRMECGLGLGAGLEIWRMQISARYFWNFGSLYTENGEHDPLVAETMKKAFSEGHNFNGFSLSAAIFF